MKTKVNQFKCLLILFCLFLIIGVGCEKDDEKSNYAEGYIVGFDPCTINHQYRIGYIFISTDLQDTLVTYNLSDPSYKMPASVLLNPSDTLYKIPESYFQNYRNSAYLPKAVRYEFKIKITYAYATNEEKKFNLCSTDFNYSDFNNAKQVIIKSAIK
ncbi:hypothetical protein BZG01_06015 [Labilibaculum manganireducens]|uniref:Uncharacterized protein n=1 Tax=Labilibaculum manganireducens TaxID=1940525 RepID=A0A2N3IC99_9BACT|nr:hypothetical protein [Labilibaculum manganireducens]PKQ67920.1 hypothetical protein BZG01_06015 [Labilibaculum manganireducens]